MAHPFLSYDATTVLFSPCHAERPFVNLIQQCLSSCNCANNDFWDNIYALARQDFCSRKFPCTQRMLLRSTLPTYLLPRNFHGFQLLLSQPVPQGMSRLAHPKLVVTYPVPFRQMITLPLQPTNPHEQCLSLMEKSNVPITNVCNAGKFASQNMVCCGTS